LLACGTRNPKFAGSGIIGLQRLVVSNALPKDTLAEVLEAFGECASLALDIQLKVLQALPSLLQNYSSSLTGKLLLTAFQVCFLLYGSRIAVVSNTAAAALQQLVNSTLEKAAGEKDGPGKDDPTSEVPIGDGTIPVSGAALDAHRLLEDICLLTDGQRPQYLLTASLVQNFGLELLESILANHADTVMAHPEQIHVLRLQLMPLIIRILSERTAFSTTVRTMRLLQLIISRLLFALAPECEMALSLLNHMLDPDAAAVWKRALCLEVFRGIHSEPALIRNIYAHYDGADEKRNIVRDHLGSMVRLASEKPAIIGIGQQSSIAPSLGQRDDSREQAALQAGGLVGSIGTPVAATESNKIGISNQWSTVRVPCIELLDKSEAPNLPATYIYSLALTCVTTFSEGLARFLLPFTIPADGRGKRKQTVSQETTDNGRALIDPDKKLSRTQSYGGRKTPINPLTLKDHVLYSQISTSGHMVEHCWPALLAASSTYLNASLDSENYHALIRSFQKFTQIAGLLDLAIPRDAFLTTLGKHAVPAMNSIIIAPESNRRGPANDLSDSDLDSSPAPSIRRQSVDLPTPTMNTRHLLCLRALLNLGIALGTVLRKSWTIILETLLQADLLLSATGQARRKQARGSAKLAENDGGEKALGAEDLGLEITAAETAASRLFEATSDLSGEAFLDFLGCLCSLLRVNQAQGDGANGLLSPQPTVRKHQKMRSMSSFPMEGGASGQCNGFVIDKIDDVIQSNVPRLLQPVTSESGWDLLLEVLNTTVGSDGARSDVRIKAANTLDDMLIAVAVSEEPLSAEELETVRGRSLDALLSEILCLRKASSQRTRASESCESEVHRLALDSLKSILEHCGDSLTIGWNSVLAIINSVFAESNDSSNDTVNTRTLSPILVRSAFDSLQLVCSDFLSSVPSSHLMTLLDTLYSFCAQHRDLNISLTTTTFFRNVSDYLQRDGENITFDALPVSKPSKADLAGWVRDSNEETSSQALWIYLLLQLESLSSDGRLEVRHSALHTLFRIFDACFDQLTTRARQLCFNVVLVEMLEANQHQYLRAQNLVEPDKEDSMSRSWNETAIVEIGGISELFSQWLHATTGDPAIAFMTHDLIGHFMIFPERQMLSVSRAAFTGLNQILTAVGEAELTGSAEHSILAKGWEMWEHGNPALHRDDSERKRNDNQEALTPYLKCLHDLLRLTGQRSSSEHIKMVLEQIWICVVKSTASAYSMDLDRMTHVQELVLESLTLAPTAKLDTIPVLARFICELVTLAYTPQSEATGEKQTYIALSKAAMTLLESFLIEHVNKHSDGIAMVVGAANALSVPMRLKYTWKSEGRGPSPWKKATMTALTILEAAIPMVRGAAGNTSPFWEVVVNINDSIIAADCDACTNPEEIPSDRDFDIDAFLSTKKVLVPALGSGSTPDMTRRKFAESIFKYSILHEPNIDDLARPGQELLEGLRSTHIGRVKDLPRSPRSKLGYLLLDELFDLVSVHDGSLERIKLAQAAAPYLILRTGLTLKAYVMDHPLRGRMPQPLSQRKEMFYILRKLIELDSEPKALPAAPGISSEHKKHLHRLYPLIMKASKVTWRDEEMTKALQEVLEAVGDDFGV